jgi:hypothetical protein
LNKLPTALGLIEATSTGLFAISSYRESLDAIESMSIVEMPVLRLREIGKELEGAPASVDNAGLAL